MNPFNDEYFMKQALVEARAAASEGEVLSLIHISEPTRP